MEVCVPFVEHDGLLIIVELIIECVCLCMTVCVCQCMCMQYVCVFLLSGSQ